MNNTLQNINQLIRDGQISLATEQLHQLLTLPEGKTAQAYYLLGNAYRKQGNWQNALNSYQEAIALDPDSPATDARRMIMDILEFYNKDMFNQ